MDLLATVGEHPDPIVGTGARYEDECALVRRAVDEPLAFALLYRRHYDRMASYLFRRTGDRHATEDLLSELFLAAWKGLPHFEHRGVPFQGWLYGIATRLANRWVGRRRPLARLEDPARVEGPDGSFARDAADEVQTHLLALAPKHQAVLTLLYLEELRVDEIAAALGIRPGTVKSRLDRARRKLKHSMQARRLS